MCDSKMVNSKMKREIKQSFEYALKKVYIVEDFDIISDDVSMDGNIKIRYNLEINNIIREKIKFAFNNHSDYQIWADYKTDNDKIIFKVDIKDH